MPFEGQFIPTGFNSHESAFELPAGTECPATGIYVVSHRNPPRMKSLL